MSFGIPQQQPLPLWANKVRTKTPFGTRWHKEEVTIVDEAILANQLVHPEAGTSQVFTNILTQLQRTKTDLGAKGLQKKVYDRSVKLGVWKLTSPLAGKRRGKAKKGKTTLQVAVRTGSLAITITKNGQRVMKGTIPEDKIVAVLPHLQDVSF